MHLAFILCLIRTNLELLWSPFFKHWRIARQKQYNSARALVQCLVRRKWLFSLAVLVTDMGFAQKASAANLYTVRYNHAIKEAVIRSSGMLSKVLQMGSYRMVLVEQNLKLHDVALAHSEFEMWQQVPSRAVYSKILS